MLASSSNFITRRGRDRAKAKVQVPVAGSGAAPVGELIRDRNESEATRRKHDLAVVHLCHQLANGGRPADLVTMNCAQHQQPSPITPSCVLNEYQAAHRRDLANLDSTTLAQARLPCARAAPERRGLGLDQPFRPFGRTSAIAAFRSSEPGPTRAPETSKTGRRLSSAGLISLRKAVATIRSRSNRAVSQTLLPCLRL